MEACHVSDPGPNPGQGVTSSFHRPTHLTYIVGEVTKRTMPRYLTDGAKKLQYETERINREVDAPNRSYLLGFKDHLELTDRKARTQERRLMELRTISKLGVCKDFKKITKEEVEEVVRRINKLKVANTEKDVSEYSKFRTKRTFKSFITWLTGSDNGVSWIKTSSKLNSTKLPEDDQSICVISITATFYIPLIISQNRPGHSEY